ncbi:hypothetical protein [Nitrososphaera viennensis]|uniref:Uncharacterized protein n=2 Tax=Nitrososphaera viennensis TaxID=1034015 RepID=A0A060HMQ2_9ARCH|nr:hypothetical protein [Nitrososphaera viennensis]AIC16400.1 hypothetical protein NVIE_021390 [Nitrososphaera viennensis EN76]UVS68334.1 hypothetical protein NWT39_10540 [Nitrososphaera viennensis]
MLSITLPMEEELCNKFINYARTNKPFKYQSLRAEEKNLIVDLDETHVSTINEFFASLIHFGRQEGVSAKEVDEMIGKGDYQDIALAAGGNHFINQFIPIMLSKQEDYKWMTERALCTQIMPFMRVPLCRVFQSFSFGEDLPRVYGYELKKAPETEYIKKTPKMFSTGKPDDENKIEQHCANIKGLGYFVRQDLLPKELDVQLVRLSDRANQLASQLGVKLNSVILTMLDYPYAAKQLQSVLIVNLRRIEQWQTILNNDRLLDAVLTYHLSHAMKSTPVMIHQEWLVNFVSLASAYEHRPAFNMQLLQTALDYYKGHYMYALSDLATFRLMNSEDLRVFLDYYAKQELLSRMEKELEIAGKPRFDSLLLAAALDVAARRKELDMQSVKQVREMADEIPFYNAIVNLMNEVWEKSSGQDSVYPAATFENLVREMFRYAMPDKPVPF